MGRDSNSILCRLSLNSSIPLLILFLGHFNGYFTHATSVPPLFNSFTISSFNYPKTKLDPFEWRYIRVDVPPWFSSVSIDLESDVDLKLSHLSKIPKSELPLICFRDGSLPMPDFSDNILDSLVLESISNRSIGEIQGFQNKEHCYPVQEKIKVTLTNEQIFPGVWYLGLFNGIGAMRTQGKMINRGNTFSFSANVSVAGCTFPNLWGLHCNQTVESLSCAQSFINSSLTSSSSASMYNQTAVQVVSCKSSPVQTCLQGTEQKMYLMEIVGLAEQLIISAADVRLNGTTSLNKTANSSGLLKAYARYGAMPSPSMHDYAANIDKWPLIIQSPKVGSWYVSIVPGNTTTEIHKSQGKSETVCYSLVLQVVECPEGKVGFNCSWERYTLQTVLQKNPSAPFRSYYMPIDGKVDSGPSAFLLEPLLSNSSMGNQSEIAWTYFTLDVPQGAAGGNMHIWLSSMKELRYEVYARFGGLPSDEVWDYFYISKTNRSDGSMFFMTNHASETPIDGSIVDFYILFVREGTWNFAIKHLNSSNVALGDETEMSISIDRCPNGCSSPHGSCTNRVDESGLTVYSYCSCDRAYGGVDCSTEMISHRGHMWQSIFLIGSNAAAILPAYWSLRQKAFPEWVIYTSSGVSSGLYHACDVGTWCVLHFHVLQFMDFWLSFMAVVSTFVYMAAISEGSRRTIHAVVSILTALMAISGATRSSNIILVIAIGATGLLIGWLIELYPKYRSMSIATLCSFNIIQGRQAIVLSLRNVIKNLLKRFNWYFVAAGFVAFTLAAVSWTVETSQTYWIWHSLWHVSIYSSSFFFLCSKATTTIGPDSHIQPGSQNEQQYELAHQDSIPRGLSEG